MMTIDKKTAYVIPMDKAVTGSDILKLAESLKISYDESHWVFGVCVNTWTKIVRDGLNSIVTNPTVALLAKYYSHHPEAVPLPKNVSFEELADVVEVSSMQYLGALTGKEKVTAHRWSKDNEKGKTFSPPVQRLVNNLFNECQEGNLAWWELMVKSEAKARGAHNIFRDSNWNAKHIKVMYDKTSLSTMLWQAIERVEAECHQQKIFIDELGFTLLQRDVDNIVKTHYDAIKKDAKIVLKSLKSKNIDAQGKTKLVVDLFSPYESTTH